MKFDHVFYHGVSDLDLSKIDGFFLFFSCKFIVEPGLCRARIIVSPP